jgi:hypothetical protein
VLAVLVRLDPNLLLRGLTAVGIKKVRCKEIADSFWARDQIEPAWKQCKEAWKRTIHRLQKYGVLSDDPLPTQAALVTLIAMLDRFPSENSFDGAFYWFVQASRFGRYSGSSTTALEEDFKDVANGSTLIDIVSKLLRRFQQVSRWKQMTSSVTIQTESFGVSSCTRSYTRTRRKIGTAPALGWDLRALNS